MIIFSMTRRPSRSTVFFAISRTEAPFLIRFEKNLATLAAMFTGLIEETGKVIALDRGAVSGRLTVHAEIVAEGARIGDSIAVNGCCLTVASTKKTELEFDLLRETIDRTNFARIA